MYKKGMQVIYEITYNIEKYMIRFTGILSAMLV